MHKPTVHYSTLLYSIVHCIYGIAIYQCFNVKDMCLYICLYAGRLIY